jgi:hypothetical protein
METMQLITTTPTTDLTTLDDDALEAYFADAGLAVSVLPHCDDVTCPVCFVPANPARAA